MARTLRLEFPGTIYHLTGRGNARQKVFFTDADRELFLNTLTGVVSRYHWICHAYCLMVNHYHLLVETPKTTLSIGMRQLNGIYTQSFNRTAAIIRRRHSSHVVSFKSLRAYCFPIKPGNRSLTPRWPATRRICAKYPA